MFRMRITADQAAQLEEFAKRSGLSRSEFCRRRIFKHQTKFSTADPEILEELRAIRKELVRQGVNYWQMINVLREIRDKELVGDRQIIAVLKSIEATEAARKVAATNSAEAVTLIASNRSVSR